MERILPLANVVLQNQVYAREKIIDDMKELFKNIGSCKEIRDVINSYIECKQNNEALEVWI